MRTTGALGSENAGMSSAREDEPSPGTLRQTVEGILTLLALLIPAFSLLNAPAVLTIDLHR